MALLRQETVEVEVNFSRLFVDAILRSGSTLLSEYGPIRWLRVDFENRRDYGQSLKRPQIIVAMMKTYNSKEQVFFF